MRWIVDHHICAWDVIKWGDRLYEGYDMAHVHQVHKAHRNIPGRAYSGAVLLVAIASSLIACGVGGADTTANSPSGVTNPGGNPPPPPPSGDTTPPTAPAFLAATTDGLFGTALSWTPSTDNVAVTGYSVERCLGAGCTAFASVGAVAGPSFTDTGLTAGTPYRYRVRATDAAANLSAYSNMANVTTLAGPDTTPPTAPAGLTATTDGP